MRKKIVNLISTSDSKQSKYWIPIKPSDKFISDILKAYILNWKIRPLRDRLILKGVFGQALLVLSKSKTQDNKIALTLFINESRFKSIDLLTDALTLARRKWPGYTVYLLMTREDSNFKIWERTFFKAKWKQSIFDDIDTAMYEISL